MSNKETIQMLADMELDFSVLAKKCSRVRKQLEKIEGSSSTSRKGNVLTAAQKNNLANKRIKALLRPKKIK